MSTKYNLELKAILDTTQVKQELQKLRQLQKQILGKDNKDNSPVGRGNLGNLNSFNSTLNRLTNSINRLNTTVNKINAFNQRILNNVQPIYTTSGKTANYMPVVAGNNPVTQLVANRDNALLRNQIAIQNAQTKLIRARQNTPNNTQAIKDQEQRLVELQNNASYISKQYNTSIEKTQKQPKMGANFTPEHKRMLLGMAAGAGINTIGTTLQASGNETAANYVSGIGTIGSYAIMGSAAGLVGAGIGAAIGAIQVAAEQVTAAFKEAADAAQVMAKRIEIAKSIDQTKNNIDEASADANALKTNDITYFQQQKNKFNNKANDERLFQSWFLKQYGSLEEFEKETNRIEQEAYDGWNDDEKLAEVERRKKLADGYRESISTLADSQSKTNNYSSIIDSLNNRSKNIDQAYKKFYSERQFNTLLNSNDKDKIELYRKQLEEELKKLKDTFEKNSKDGFKATNSEKVLENIIDTEGRIDRINVLLNNLNKIDQSKTRLETQETLLSPLQDALSKLTAPDMSNVNSLAGQGVMINRADDNSRQESILNYQRTQTELQQEIKKLLKDNSFTSTIM